VLDEEDIIGSARLDMDTSPADLWMEPMVVVVGKASGAAAAAAAAVGGSVSAENTTEPLV
jgi:hypothetical protein